LGRARCVWHAQPRPGASRTGGPKTRKVRDAARAPTDAARQHKRAPHLPKHVPIPQLVPSNHMLQKTRPGLRNYAPPCPPHINFEPLRCWPLRTATWTPSRTALAPTLTEPTVVRPLPQLVPSLCPSQRPAGPKHAASGVVAPICMMWASTGHREARARGIPL
jgi:hypothetical protein